MNISVSLMNDFDNIATDEYCGWYFWHNYILKDVPEKEASTAMKLGQYFEFLATGQGLRDGSDPKPETTQKGELTAPFKKVLPQVEYFKKFMEYHKIQLIETGTVYISEYKGITIKGIFDITALWNESPVIIDLKYSGLIDNKWETYGWGHQDIGLLWRKVLQAVEYVWLYEQKEGERIPFYYYVGSASDNQRKVFKCNVTDRAIEKMLGQVVYTNEMIEIHNATGWNPTRNYLNCIDCPLKETCEHCVRVPEIKEVTI